MKCPECDTPMYRDECGCGFKVPSVSTVEIKQMGAQESSVPVVMTEDVEKMLSTTKLTGRPFAELCVSYCLDVLKKAGAKKQTELLMRKRHVN
jgi:hypothetical protein